MSTTHEVSFEVTLIEIDGYSLYYSETYPFTSLVEAVDFHSSLGSSRWGEWEILVKYKEISNDK